jgi:hypothetical protein
MGWTKESVLTQGVIKYGGNLYCYAALNASIGRIYRTIAYTTAVSPPTYTIAGDEAMEVAEYADITMGGTLAAGQFIGGGGYAFLLSKNAETGDTVVTVDLSTLEVLWGDGWDFDVACITCDSDGNYYVGQNGDEATDTPMHVHKMTLDGIITVYDGDISGGIHGDLPEDHEHYVEHIYVSDGKVFLSCGYNPVGTNPLTWRWITELTASTMTFDCRTEFSYTSPPASLHGFTDFVSDGTYIYSLAWGSTVHKHLIGALGFGWAEVGGSYVGNSADGHGMLYWNGHIYRSYPGHIRIYDTSDLTFTDVVSNLTLYRAITDGTETWLDWRVERALSRAPAPVDAADEKLFQWKWLGSGQSNAVWYMGI